jgi:putative aminopeptidase FrvX
VNGRTELPGMVVPTPTRLLPSSVRPGVVPLEYMLIDTGLPPDEVASIVRVGDPVSFAQEPLETSGDTLVGRTLDNRAGVAALTLCLDILHSRSHAWDVWAVATVQEETNYGGALTSAFQLHPDLGVTIDVTFGSEQSSPGYLTFPLGKGPTLGWGPVVHPYLFKTMKQLAERLEIPLATETAPRYSGTDSDVMVMAAEGVPNMVIGIPLRYMHTPVEMVALKDISRAGRLVAEFIAELDKNFMDKLTWED